MLFASTLLLAVVMRAQSPPAFDVASVKLVLPPFPPGGGPWTFSHGRFKADIAWLRGVIALAYDVRGSQVHGGPDWVDSDRYDFAAKAESADAGQDELKAMLRTMLADRFKLAVRRETQELQVYTLSLGKDGHKMQEAKADEKTYGNWAGSTRGTSVTCTRMDVAGGLVNIISNTLGSPVLDKTGLKGLYDFKLEFTDPRFHRLAGADAPADAAPDLFAAVQEQLGLKLEAKKGPVEIVIVDHIERPSAN
jgi:uncharacterized protein (TIGR03435 family)